MAETNALISALRAASTEAEAPDSYDARFPGFIPSWQTRDVSPLPPFVAPTPQRYTGPSIADLRAQRMSAAAIEALRAPPTTYNPFTEGWGNNVFGFFSPVGSMLASAQAPLYAPDPAQLPEPISASEPIASRLPVTEEQSPQTQSTPQSNLLEAFDPVQLIGSPQFPAPTPTTSQPIAPPIMAFEPVAPPSPPIALAPPPSWLPEPEAPPPISLAPPPPPAIPTQIAPAMRPEPMQWDLPSLDTAPIPQFIAHDTTLPRRAPRNAAKPRGLRK